MLGPLHVDGSLATLRETRQFIFLEKIQFLTRHALQKQCFSWTTYPPKPNGFRVWRSSFRGELVLLVREANEHLISLHDCGFN